MKRFQITKKFDWFSQKEIIEIIKKLKDGERVEIIKLNDKTSLRCKDKMEKKYCGELFSDEFENILTCVEEHPCKDCEPVEVDEE